MAITLLILGGCISTIASVGEVVGKTYLQSKAEEAKARRQAKYIAEEISRTEKNAEKNGLEDFKFSREKIIEQHVFGDNIVFVHEADKRDKHGHIFIAYNKEKKIIMGWLFCSDEKDTYSKFTKMNLLEKKLFLLESFQKFANVNLGPVYPQIGTTYEQAVAAIGVPDDRIPLYYEEGIVVSEMLIYYAPKKFLALAVGIARGKVVRTQEFALQEGQGLKDALASAGITPAATP
ncbi:hypothetical protein L6249_00185 [Candidatus Parcubacteria bacterium]|nr:hypothetical protein [Patescibacteria group bacterium]MCG2690480.1 hypothetical protein [Candidatus Parcubacteria bacterium]